MPKKYHNEETTYTYRKWDSISGRFVDEVTISAGTGGITQEHIDAIYEAEHAENLQNYYNRLHLEQNPQDIEMYAENCLSEHNSLDNLLEQLTVLLALLTERQRDFIYLYYGQQLSFAEIARREGVTEGAIRHRNTKIINRLKKLFEGSTDF